MVCLTPSQALRVLIIYGNWLESLMSVRNSSKFSYSSLRVSGSPSFRMRRIYSRPEDALPDSRAWISSHRTCSIRWPRMFQRTCRRPCSQTIARLFFREGIRTSKTNIHMRSKHPTANKDMRSESCSSYSCPTASVSWGCSAVSTRIFCQLMIARRMSTLNPRRERMMATQADNT